MLSDDFSELRYEEEHTKRGHVVITTLYILRTKYLTPIPVSVAERNPDAVVESINASPHRDDITGFYFADRVDTVAVIGEEYIKLTGADSFNYSGVYWLYGAKTFGRHASGSLHMVDRSGEDHILRECDVILDN